MLFTLDPKYSWLNNIGFSANIVQNINLYFLSPVQIDDEEDWGGESSLWCQKSNGFHEMVDHGCSGNFERSTPFERTFFALFFFFVFQLILDYLDYYVS